MSQPSTIPQQLMTCSLPHFEQGVPIDDLDLRTEHRARLARVEHVYWIWMKNPFIDVFPMFKQIIKGKYANPQSEWLAAKKDKILFDFVVEHVSPPSRKVSEQKVRVSADHLMKIGMETDNGYNIEAGAKLLMKLDRLDQPEDNRADMSKAAFLPSVVVTDIRQVDDTKENIDDEETKRIIAKYGGYVDEKHQMIEDKVALMEAKRTGNEQDRDESEHKQ
jgi:hypothetical protein